MLNTTRLNKDSRNTTETFDNPVKCITIYRKYGSNCIVQTLFDSTNDEEMMNSQRCLHD